LSLIEPLFKKCQEDGEERAAVAMHRVYAAEKTAESHGLRRQMLKMNQRTNWEHWFPAFL